MIFMLAAGLQRGEFGKLALRKERKSDKISKLSRVSVGFHILFSVN